MKGIYLVWDSAYADSVDTANRRMRKDCRKVWNEEDQQAACDRLDHLAVVFYRENIEDDPNVDIDLARYSLHQTKGYSIITGKPREGK